jgi:Ca2+-binding EF-hand superfamily protein
VIAMDDSYGNWNQRPGEFVNAHLFVANFLSSISVGHQRFVTGRLLQQADTNADGRMSRSEAKQFLMLQIGIRWPDGPRLRERTGRLVRLNRFIEMDQDRDNSISRAEFDLKWPDQRSLEDDFRQNDTDANGVISYREYADPSGANYFDPVEWFRRADTNLDALLDFDELQRASSPERSHLVASSLSSFDDDSDGKLSLRDYRLSMHANVNYTWEAKLVDRDGDGWLSYEEFAFNRVDLFQLQRRFYFHRLDRDGDQRLTVSEFEF